MEAESGIKRQQITTTRFCSITPPHPPPPQHEDCFDQKITYFAIYNSMVYVKATLMLSYNYIYKIPNV